MTLDQSGRWLSLTCLDSQRRPQIRLRLDEGLADAVDRGEAEDLAAYEAVERAERRRFLRREESPYGEWQSVWLEPERTALRLYAMLNRDAILRVVDSLRFR